jgi:hypothetical protein
MAFNTKVLYQPWLMRLPHAKILLTGLVIFGLIGVVIFAAVREIKVATNNVGTMMEPLRPAFTAAEEAYVSTLWPIHSDVKLSAVSMTFAGLYYKLGEIDRNTLKSKLKPVAENFEKAALRLRQIEPPASMEKIHWNYVRAVKLYQDSVTEMAKVVDDGRDEHLIAAQAQSEQAATILLKVGSELWPGEYKPN